MSTAPSTRRRPRPRPRPVELLPAVAFAATFGVFFVDRTREARTVLSSGRGVATVVAIVVAYAIVAVLVRRLARRAWVAPVVLAAVVVALAAWIVRPYYVDSTVERRLVENPTGPAPPAAAPSSPAAGPATPVVVASGPLAGLGHEARGTASLIRTPDGSLVVRLGDFEIEGVPDPRVHLVDRGDARRPGGVDLGRLSGNRGTVLDIPVPAGVPAGPGWTVLVWCRAFSVPVANATLGAAGA